MKQLDTRNQKLQKREHDMKEINFVIAKGMPHAETTSADEEIETIAKLVQENHQCADDVEVITVKPVLSGHPWVEWLTDHLIQVRIPTYGIEDQVKEP